MRSLHEHNFLREEFGIPRASSIRRPRRSVDRSPRRCWHCTLHTWRHLRPRAASSWFSPVRQSVEPVLRLLPVCSSSLAVAEFFQVLYRWKGLNPWICTKTGGTNDVLGRLASWLSSHFDIRATCSKLTVVCRIYLLSGHFQRHYNAI